MATYLIADITVTNPEGYEEYRHKVPAIIARYGGRYLARGGATEVLEGDPQPGRMVILEFPSMEQAHAFYNSPEYAPLIQVRRRNATGDLLLLEGI